MSYLQKRFLLAILPLTVITFISFYPSLKNGWTSWDDTLYVTENPYITEVSLENIGTVFSRVLEGSYVPMTMISYMIDYRIGGYDPAVYHTTNLLLHLCNTILAFFLVYLLSGNLTAAFVAGVLFGIHPMRVESVAWISGRKDLLSMFFFLLSSISYLKYLDSKRYSFLSVAFVLFVLAIFSKTIILTFPLILFLYDYQRKRKFTIVTLNEKLPFFLVAFAITLVGFYGQQSIGAMKKSTTFIEHFTVALHGPVFYLEKLFLPVNLSNLYTYPAVLTFSFYCYAFLFLLFAILVWKFRKNSTLVFGALFFVISLLPVMQIIKFSTVFAADRFTYLAYIGCFYIIGTLSAQWWERYNKRMLLTAFSIIVIAFSNGTWKRCEVWKDNSTLWQDMLSKYPSPLE